MSIEVNNLTFSYGKRKVLEDISLNVSDSCLCTLLGANGSGKTTMFKCILGMLKKYSGEIKIDGTSTKQLTEKEMAHKVAYIPQIHGATFDYSVRDMVMMGTDHTLAPLAVPGKAQIKKAEEAIERVGLAGKSNKFFTRLSGGEQQLVLIARALAQGSKTLLMDEPTSALDYGNQTLIMEQLSALAKEGYCIMISTHTPQHALWYANKIIALKDNKIKAEGSSEILDEELIKELYKIDVKLIETEEGKIIYPKCEK